MTQDCRRNLSANEVLECQERPRYQAGLCISDDPLGLVFGQLPLAIGYDVYLRERALTPRYTVLLRQQCVRGRP